MAKKKKEIRIIKNDSNKENYTFVNDSIITNIKNNESANGENKSEKKIRWANWKKDSYNEITAQRKKDFRKKFARSFPNIWITLIEKNKFLTIKAKYKVVESYIGLHF